MSAEEIAAAYLEGKIAPLQTALQLLGHESALRPIWEASNGAYGPLVALHIVSDEIDRIGFFGVDEKLWHPDVREAKRAEFAAVEARLAEPIKAACLTILEYRAAAKMVGNSN